MTRAIALLVLLAAACAPTSGPRVDAAVAVTPGGVRVVPSAGMRVGGVGVRVSP